MLNMLVETKSVIGEEMESPKLANMLQVAFNPEQTNLPGEGSIVDEEVLEVDDDVTDDFLEDDEPKMYPTNVDVVGLILGKF